MQSTTYPWLFRRDGRIVCRECNHLYSEYGESHYPDCRFYVFEEDDNDEIYEILYEQDTVDSST